MPDQYAASASRTRSFILMHWTRNVFLDFADQKELPQNLTFLPSMVFHCNPCLCICTPDFFDWYLCILPKIVRILCNPRAYIFMCWLFFLSFTITMYLIVLIIIVITQTQWKNQGISNKHCAIFSFWFHSFD